MKNLWGCDHPGCKRTVAGEGGAIGLMAIGWYFRGGPVIFCPEHRPDPIPCKDSGSEHAPECRMCAAEREAKRWQALIEGEVAKAELDEARAELADSLDKEGA